VKITFTAPLPFKAAQVESYTLTCEQSGKVFGSQQVVVDRGQRKTLDLRACASAIRQACAADTIGLRSVSAKSDGLYFVRYRMKTRTGRRSETRRLVLARRDGRFHRRPGFYRRATCDLLPSYELERAAFGGAQRTPLRIAFRVAARARAQVTVLRGEHVGKRFKAHRYRARRIHRLRLRSARLRRGDYNVRIAVGRGKGRVRATLTSRRL